MTAFSAGDRPLRGIAFVVLGFACFGVTDALSKAGLETMSTAQMLAIRSVVVLLLMLLMSTLNLDVMFLLTLKNQATTSVTMLPSSLSLSTIMLSPPMALAKLAL